MKNDKCIETLNDLIQLDVDAVHAYGQAIDAIDVAAVKDALIQFQGDHQRHIDTLSAEVRRIGGTPTEPSRDFKGFLIEGFTAVRSMTGTEGALRAMVGNEETTNKAYREALEEELPPEARRIVERNYEDEKRHLNYVRGALESRAWERAA